MEDYVNQLEKENEREPKPVEIIPSPISSEKSKELIEFLNNNLAFGIRKNSGCDGTLRFTKKWCIKAGINFSQMKTFLEQHGGFCDCEVLVNQPMTEVTGL